MDWIIQYGERVTIAALLAMAIFARYKEWWVDGPTFRRCLENVAEVKKEVTEHKQRMDKRMEELETKLERPWRGGNG